VPVVLCFEKEYPDGLPEGQFEARPSESVDLEVNLLEMGEGAPPSGCVLQEYSLMASTARWLRLTDNADSTWLLAFDAPDATSLELELGETLNVSFRAGPDVQTLGTFHQSALVLSRNDEPIMFIADGSYADDVAALVADVVELSREDMICESYDSECSFRYWSLRLRIGDEEGVLDPAQGLGRIGDFVNRSAPTGRPSGPEGMLHTFNQVLRPAFPDLKVEIHEQIAEGDKVTTRKPATGQ
jgi:hypothetical protein